MIGSALSLSRRSLEISHKTKRGRSMKKWYGAKMGERERMREGGRERRRERMREGGREREAGCFRIPNGQEHHTINRLERRDRERDGWGQTILRQNKKLNKTEFWQSPSGVSCEFKRGPDWGQTKLKPVNQRCIEEKIAGSHPWLKLQWEWWIWNTSSPAPGRDIGTEQQTPAEIDTLESRMPQSDPGDSSTFLVERSHSRIHVQRYVTTEATRCPWWQMSLIHGTRLHKLVHNFTISQFTIPFLAIGLNRRKRNNYQVVDFPMRFYTLKQQYVLPQDD